MRGLFKKSIDVSAALPKDVRIASLAWHRKISLDGDRAEGTITGQIEQKLKMAKVTIESDKELLELKMLIVDNNAASGKANVSKPLVLEKKELLEEHSWRTFSKTEILAFVKDIQDKNPIHRQAPYIVPGCLLLEQLVKIIQNRYPSQELASVTLRFKDPAYADDFLWLVIHNQDFTIETFRHVIGTGKFTFLESR